MSSNPVDFKNYGTLTKNGSNWYLTIKPNTSIPDQLLFYVTATEYNKYDIVYNLTVKTSELYEGENAWLNNYTTRKNDSENTITLTHYSVLDSNDGNSVAKEINLPKEVTIGGIKYRIVISGNVYQDNTNLEKISFADGVIADSSLASMFKGCSNLKNVDMSGLNTTKTNDMSSMFESCTALTNDGVSSSIKFKNGNFTTSKVTNMSRMFANSGIKQLDFSAFDTSSLLNMSSMFTSCASLEIMEFKGKINAGSDLTRLFSQCISLKRIDLSGLNTANTTNMSFMFNGCSSLTNDGNDSYIKFKNGDTSYFATNNVTDMTYMFSSSGIKNIDLSSFNTSSLTEMSGMFAYCSNLTSIDLSNFSGAISDNFARDDTSDANGPLVGCTSLKEVTLGKNWKAKDNNTYLGLALEGNWQNTVTKEIITAETLQKDFVASMAGTYQKTDLPPSGSTAPQYIVDGYTKPGNMWEVHAPSATFHGYCLNHDKLSPSGYFDKVEIDVNATESTKITDSKGRSNYIMDYLDSKDYGYQEIAPNMAKALVALIYWSEYGGHGGTYDQNDIWHFTNDYSSPITSKLSDKIKGHTYGDIGKELKLYIYVPSENNKANNASTKKMQNLLSIEGATDQTYAGVQIKKVDDSNNAVAGAEFTVYKADTNYNMSNEKFGNGEKSLTFTTNSNGIGGLYRMDNSQGLTSGNYILKETKSPLGYEINDYVYRFKVAKDKDSQKLINSFEVVDKNGNTISDSNIVTKAQNGIIIDKKKDDWHGGGITITKKDFETEKSLAGAIFTIYDSTGKVIEELPATDLSGTTSTRGNKDLKIGETYIVEETTAPEGYNKEVTLIKDFHKSLY